MGRGAATMGMESRDRRGRRWRRLGKELEDATEASYFGKNIQVRVRAGCRFGEK